MQVTCVRASFPSCFGLWVTAKEWTREGSEPRHKVSSQRTHIHASVRAKLQRQEARPSRRISSHSQSCQDLSENQQVLTTQTAFFQLVTGTWILSSFEFLCLPLGCFSLFFQSVLSVFILYCSMNCIASLLFHFRHPLTLLFIVMFVFQTHFLPIAGKGTLVMYVKLGRKPAHWRTQPRLLHEWINYELLEL